MSNEHTSSQKRSHEDGKNDVDSKVSVPKMLVLSYRLRVTILPSNSVTRLRLINEIAA